MTVYLSRRPDYDSGCLGLDINITFGYILGKLYCGGMSVFA